MSEFEDQVAEIVRRACYDYADGLVRGPVLTRPERRAAAINDAVEKLLAIANPLTPPSQVG